MSEGVNTNQMSPPSSPFPSHLVPSPLITRRTRTASTCEKIVTDVLYYGTIKAFCREKGHGFIIPENGGENIFVHVSDIEGEFVPLPDDRVSYRLCPIPPKFEKYQAVHVQIVDLKPHLHKRWAQHYY
ncbi:cold shock domain-containing protein CG9705 [Cylas formicarius]|uniref:cold shock domain-containing protein CG9705 n=1 Tax=Cylas formicarius TaxID=197179 RepID=UPI0029585BDE|nr:cold shock domain-containing protein CG9705 [Cylas formicarius]